MNENRVNNLASKTTLGITMGDPAGIGPEIIVKAWPALSGLGNCNPVVFGDAGAIELAARQVSVALHVRRHDSLEAITFGEAGIDVVQTNEPGAFEPGKVAAVSGDAAFRAIVRAIDDAKSGEIDAIVTAPINKEAIQLAGHDFPGHTELLAERCGVSDFAMMLYIPPGQSVGGDIGVGVVHTTLHQSMRSALDCLTTENILSKIQLANEFGTRALVGYEIERAPRIVVAALNPHAGENGLFGDEEATIIEPAVKKARILGIDCHGPISCDTLMGRAVNGEFDLVVAMYHDQGHIALKLLGMHKAVNITVGLPIVRTSVAHGTAFEIAHQGKADCTSLMRAVDSAIRLTKTSRQKV